MILAFIIFLFIKIGPLSYVGVAKKLSDMTFEVILNFMKNVCLHNIDILEIF